VHQIARFAYAYIKKYLRMGAEDKSDHDFRVSVKGHDMYNTSQ